MTLDTFTRAYVECALWLCDEDPPSGEWSEYPPYTADNIDAETLARMIADCERFQAEHGSQFDGHIGRGDALERAGHDFYLTRNGHGAGFWDGDWTEDIGERLTRAAHTFGEFSLYIGDDGRIYGM